MKCIVCRYPGGNCTRCPEYTSEAPSVPCSHCGSPIFEDDWYWDLPGGIVCSDCIDSLTAQDVLEEILGYKADTMKSIDARRSA